MAKKNNETLINKAIVVQTLKIYKAEIKTRRAALNKQYKALDKDEDALYTLEDSVRELQTLLSAVNAFGKVAA
jgi:hypothetical protein